MNRDKIGFVFCVIYLIVSFSQLHTIIPGFKAVKPGLISSLIVTVLILPNIFNKKWLIPLGKYRLFLILAIIPGIINGYAEGKTRSVFIYSIQELIVCFIGISFFVNSINKLKILNNIMIITAISISQYVLTHGGHGPGILSDENDVGLVLTMLLPFIYFSVALFDKKYQKMFLVALIVITLLSVATTVSRGAMVGVLPTLLIIWYKSKNKFASLVFLVLALILVIMISPPQLISEFESIQDTTGGTAGQRRYYWTLSIEMFKKRPLFGVGAMAWGNAVWGGLINLPMQVRNSTPHSVYFQLISELGSFGTICWLLLIGNTFKTALQIKSMLNDIRMNFSDPDTNNQVMIIDAFTNSLSAGLVGGLICGLFLSFLFYTHLYVFIGLMQATYIVSSNLYENTRQNSCDTSEYQ